MTVVFSMFLLTLLVITALAVVHARNLFVAVMLSGIFSLLLALNFFLLSTAVTTLGIWIASRVVSRNQGATCTCTGASGSPKLGLSRVPMMTASVVTATTASDTSRCGDAEVS